MDSVSIYNMQTFNENLGEESQDVECSFLEGIRHEV
jgi:hypothetical protein